MTREDLQEALQRLGSFQFSRSGGPGGQNVNKVNSRVQLKVALEDLDLLTEIQKNRLRAKLTKRISSEDEMMISVEDTRDQHRNRELAVQRLAEEITAALRRPKKRVSTRPTRASKERTRKKKQKRKEIKSLRKSPSSGD